MSEPVSFSSLASRGGLRQAAKGSTPRLRAPSFAEQLVAIQNILMRTRGARATSDFKARFPTATVADIVVLVGSWSDVSARYAPGVKGRKVHARWMTFVSDLAKQVAGLPPGSELHRGLAERLWRVELPALATWLDSVKARVPVWQISLDSKAELNRARGLLENGASPSAVLFASLGVMAAVYLVLRKVSK